MSEQMSESNLDLVSKMRMLTPEERQHARQSARQTLERKLAPALPAEPKVEDFEIRRVSRFPGWTKPVQYGILILILLFGFAPSAMRVFSYGSELFSHVINNNWQSAVAGFSLVMMAELSQVGFSIARIFTKEPEEGEWLSARTLFLIGTIAATAIALVFNIEVTLVRSAGEASSFTFGGLTLAGWLDATIPPTFVLLGAHGIVHLILDDMEQNQAQNNAFDTAHYEWRQTCQNIRDKWQEFVTSMENTQEFQRAYRAQLRQSLREVNRNLGYAAMDKLPDRLWANRIAKELQAETALDDEITKLLDAKALRAAKQEDVIEAIPENFSHGS